MLLTLRHALQREVPEIKGELIDNVGKVGRNVNLDETYRRELAARKSKRQRILGIYRDGQAKQETKEDDIRTGGISVAGARDGQELCGRGIPQRGSRNMLRPWRQEKMAGRLRPERGSYWKIHGAPTHTRAG